eukprot:2017479-Rhodomonas_salina.1
MQGLRVFVCVDGGAARMVQVEGLRQQAGEVPFVSGGTESKDGPGRQGVLRRKCHVAAGWWWWRRRRE